MFKVEGQMAESVQSAFADEWFEETGEVLVGPAFFPASSPKGTLPYVAVITSPTEYTTPIESLYVLSIDSAKNRIWITNPYFVPDQEMRDALVSAAKRGVDVRILIPAPHFSPVHQASETSYKLLLAAGVKLYEYPGLIHTKTLVADDTWSIIGSANLDNRSRSINDEDDLGVTDPALTKTLADTFTGDSAKAHLVTLDEWNSRKWLAYIPSHLSLLFEKQY